MRTRARAPSRATARPLGGEGSKATDRARGLGDSPDVLRAAQGCSHLQCRAAPGRARRRGAACSPPRGHCQCGGDRPGVGRASPWGSGQCSRPPRARPLAERQSPERAEASHVRGGSCPRARPAPRVRVVSVRGHRPLLSTVQTTPCASRGAGRRACWPPGAARPRAAPRATRARPSHHDRHHAPHPPTINRI